MTVQMSGTRNGDDWPAKGTSIALPTAEAEALIACGNAVAGKVETATVEAPEKR